MDRGYWCWSLCSINSLSYSLRCNLKCVHCKFDLSCLLLDWRCKVCIKCLAVYENLFLRLRFHRVELILCKLPQTIQLHLFSFCLCFIDYLKCLLKQHRVPDTLNNHHQTFNRVKSLTSADYLAALLNVKEPLLIQNVLVVAQKR